MSDPTDEERWAEARAVLTEGPSPQLLARLRRRRRVLWLSVVALVVVGIAVGLLLALVSPHHRSAGHDDGDTALSLACYGLGLALEATGLVLLVRSGAVKAEARSSMLPLTRRQRRLLLHQVVGKEAVDPASLDLARDLARRLARQSPALPVILSGLALTGAARLASRPTVAHVVAETAGALFLVALAALGAQQSRRARRFLAEHPAGDRS